MTFLWLLEGIRTPFLDKLMQFITYFGQELIIITFICTLYWCVDKRFAYFMGFSYFTAGLAVQTLKITFRIPRPWVLDTNFHAVESAISGATGYSFPSGHTQGATCLFFPLALKARKKWVKFLCIMAFLSIGFSRMYLGCHTPKDVLGSMALSLCITLLLWKYQAQILDQETHLKWITLLMMLLAIAAAIYAYVLYSNDTISGKYAADCLKASGAGLGFASGYYIERKWLRFDLLKEQRMFSKILRVLIGLFVALLIKEGLPLLIGTSILAKSLKYFILVMWVLVIYPYIFNNVLRRNA